MLLASFIECREPGAVLRYFIYIISQKSEKVCVSLSIVQMKKLRLRKAELTCSKSQLGGGRARI